MSARGIEEIQKRLQARGYDIAKIDGKAGMNTRALIGAYQQASRLKVDCWPSEAVLAHLRANAATEKTEADPQQELAGSALDRCGGLSCQAKWRILAANLDRLRRDRKMRWRAILPASCPIARSSAE